MASQIEIFNTALTALGLSRVLSIDDDTEPAIVMKTLWSLQKDAELQSHAWSFAIKRLEVPALAAPAVFGFSKQYQLPDDYLSMVEVGENFVFYTPVDQRTLFAIEGRQVLTDEGSPLRIRYVKKIDNAGEFPPMFANAFAMRLALAACTRLTESQAKKQEMMQEYKMAMANARRSNNIEKPPQRIPDESWILARR